MNADAKPTVAATSYAKPTVYRHFHRIAWLAVALALGVIVFGAFVRLSNAGLSCPDWPTCYGRAAWPTRSEEHTSELQSLMRISYAVFCLKKKKNTPTPAN